MKYHLSSEDLAKSSIALQNLLRDNGGKWHILERIRNELPAANFDRAVTSIVGTRRYADRLFHPQFPQNVVELNPTSALQPMSAKRELQWARAYLKPHVANLRKFVSLANTFYSQMASGQIGAASATLSQIEAGLGQSLWLLKAKIFFEQSTQGLDAQRTLTAQLVKQIDGKGILAPILHFISERNEPSVTTVGLRRRLGQYLSPDGIPDDFVAYIQYHVLPVPGAVGESIAGILCHESYGTVIDFYIAVVHSLPAALDSVELRSTAISLVRALRSTGSRRLQFLSQLFGESPCQAQEPRYAQMLDAYLRGRYAQASELAFKLTERDPLHPEGYYYLALARILSAEKQFVGDSAGAKIAQDLRSVLAGDDRSDIAAEQLEKVVLNWAGSSITAMISKTLANHARPNSFAGHNLSAARSLYGHPVFSVEWIENISDVNLREAYSTKLLESSATQLTGAYAEALRTGDLASIDVDELSTEQRSILAGTIARNRKDIVAYYDEAVLLMQSPQRYYRNIGVRWSTDALLASADIITLVRSIATIIVADASVRPFVPLRQTLALMDKQVRKALRAELGPSIVLDLYSRFEGAHLDDLRSSVCEAFLAAHKVARPSQLRDASFLPRDQWLYFLRNVCTEDVLDASQAFTSSQSVAEERLAICKQLIGMDEQNRGIYESEVSDILRRLVVKRRMREIDESKISVDLSRIRANLPALVTEASNRYASFRDTGMSRQDRRRIERILADTLTKKGISGTIKVMLPKVESTEALRTAVEGIRDEYVSSTEYGLDGILSMSIRHGTFAARLRNPLEVSQLVTKRDSKTREYRKNTRWLDSVENAAESAAIDRMTTALSENFDALVEEIVGQWFRVKKVEGDTGDFDFTISEEDLDAIDALLPAQADQEQLVGASFSVLTDRLKNRLRYVRAKLEFDAKPRAVQLLAQFEMDLLTITDPIAGDLRAAIGAARTDLQHAFERVLRWFNLAQGSTTEDFFIDDAILLAETSVRWLEPSFVANVTIDQPDTYKFQGRLLSSLFYLLYNAFENIAKSTNVNGPRCSVSIQEVKREIHVDIRNTIHPDVRADVRRGVDEAVRRLNEEPTNSFVGKEGGTGLPKMRAILARDFDRAETLSLDLHDDNVVQLKFHLNFPSTDESATG